MNRLARFAAIAALELAGILAGCRSAGADVLYPRGVDIVVRRVDNLKSDGTVLQVKIHACFDGKPDASGYYSMGDAVNFLRGAKGPYAPYEVVITTGVKLAEYSPLLDAVQQNPSLNLRVVKHATLSPTPVYEFDDSIR